MDGDTSTMRKPVKNRNSAPPGAGGENAELAPAGTYMLYCGKGVMSRLHAGHLKEDSGLDIKVYAP